MEILFDSRQKKYKTPFGCLRQGEPCSIMIQIPSDHHIQAVSLCLEDDMGNLLNKILLQQDAGEHGYLNYRGRFKLEECGLYYYYFEVQAGWETFFVWKHEDKPALTGNGKWQLTCFARGYDTPQGFQGKVMYQIFPDRFFQKGTCDTSGKLKPFVMHQSTDETPVYRPDEKGIVQNNDFFGGNLQGIMEKLPYLEELGVQVLYLNPIFSAYSNHRYDTCDYKAIDPLLGTEEDFCALCEAVHKRGMKLLLDGVFSHTGERSIYFDKYREHGTEGAYGNPDSPYRSWFQFDPKDPNGYHSWWGINTLPCTEELDPGFLDYIIEGEDSVVAHWLRLGADGFRLDVADELPDEFIARLHRRVKELNPNALVLGEVWEDASYKISYSVRRKYFTNQELDATMNYPYKDAVIGYVKGEQSSGQLAQTVMSIAENYPKPVLDCVMNSLSTHDTMRILTVLGANQYPQSKEERANYRLSAEEYQKAVQRLKLAGFLQFMLPGCPCIYYGDEIGMQGFEDPLNRAFFDWEHQDKELQRYFKELARLKKQHTALQTGTIQVLADRNGVVCFQREALAEKLVFITCMNDHYECFTNYSIEMMAGGEWEDGCLRLSKYGFALLRAR